MPKPDYKGGSIVNLMSSISKSMGDRPKYPTLRHLPAKELKESKNIVLFVLDGLGYEYVKKYGKNSVFADYLRGSMTSVFPSTTAACVTTFATGVAPQQHAITGWFVNLKEMGAVTAVLPFGPRYGGLPYDNYGYDKSLIFDQKQIHQKIKGKHFYIMPKYIIKEDSRKGKMTTMGYNTLKGLFRRTKSAIKSPGKKYIYSYWPEFDSLCHEFGSKSKIVKEHFRELDGEFTSFIESIRNTNTTLIITADHGHIDSPKSKQIKLSSHPKLQQCLTLPLCGEPRAAYCYVRPSKTREFERYVKTKLKNVTLYKSRDLVKRGYFGLFRESEKLFDRIGDYVLIPKDNYIIKDALLDQKESFFIGNHGGLSDDEMLVPLVVIKR